MVKSQIGKIVLIAGLGAAALVALNAASGAASSNAESGAALGGEDTSVTAEGNPFASLDPNYQYPETSTPYFEVTPEGTVTPISINPDTGAITTISAEGINTDNNGDGAATAAPGEGAIADPNAPKWYDNPLAQGALFAGGYLAAESGYNVIKGKLFKGTPKTDVPTAGSNKGLDLEKTPFEGVRDKLGFEGSAKPQEEILRAKYTTDSDFSVRGEKIAEGGKLRDTGEFKAEVGGGKSKIAKAGETATKALIVGHVIDRSFGAWNDYGTQLLESKQRNIPGGVETYITPESKAKAVAFTGAKATTDILGDLFGFTTGLVYRPHTETENREGQMEGWFASERELWEGIKNPGEFISSLTGFGEVKRAVTGDQANYKVNAASTVIQPSVKATETVNKLMAQMSIGPTMTQSSVNPVSSSPSKRSTDLKINPKTGTYEASNITFSTPKKDSSGLSASDKSALAKAQEKQSSGQKITAVPSSLVSSGKASWDPKKGSYVIKK